MRNAIRWVCLFVLCGGCSPYKLNFSGDCDGATGEAACADAGPDASLNQIAGHPSNGADSGRGGTGGREEPPVLVGVGGHAGSEEAADAAAGNQPASPDGGIGMAADGGVAMQADPSVPQDQTPAAPSCGNGIREDDELCDGADCPTQCTSTGACVKAELEGSAESCTAKCVTTEITECGGADGCCPNGCNYGSDMDCSKECGDGELTEPEKCDSSSAEHKCPTTMDCDDGNPCTADKLTGSAELCSAECAHMPITAPVRGDGCCPASANIGNDGDCMAACGDGVVSSGEACDTKLSGSCPSESTCERMGSGCMRGRVAGSGCGARCEMEMIDERMDGDGCCPSGANVGNDSDCDASCGDGVVSSGEACDTKLSGSCPSEPTCERMGSGCMRGRLTGSGCNARCELQTITERRDDDECCPSGANAGNDNDCKPTCGDGVVSSGEACDTRLSGSCPSAATCEAMGSGCMRGRLSGSGCSARCETQPITERRNDDQCCPDGASVANDNDCPAVCGDGVVSRGETCDGEASCAQTAKSLCDDGNDCTDDTLESGNTPCTPSTTCRHTPSQTPECDLDPWD